MKNFMFLAVALLSFFLASCTEEGFTKVFQCDRKYPYFSTITHKCYESESALEGGEKDYLAQMGEDGKPTSDKPQSDKNDSQKKDDAEEDEDQKKDNEDEEDEDQKKDNEDEEDEEN